MTPRPLPDDTRPLVCCGICGLLPTDDPDDEPDHPTGPLHPAGLLCESCQRAREFDQTLWELEHRGDRW